MNIIQSVREDSSKIEEPCKCGGVAMHHVNDEVMCCECYMKAGHAPADWHPDCMKWDLIVNPKPVFNFKVGDLVEIHNEYSITDGTKAIIAKLSTNGYVSYAVNIDKLGYYAWVYERNLTLLRRVHT